MIQTRAWQTITGLADDRIGEDICLMSAEADPDFMRGCADAARFFEAIHCRTDPADPDVSAACAETLASDPSVRTPGTASVFGRGGFVAASLWARYFEEGIS